MFTTLVTGKGGKHLGSSLIHAHPWDYHYFYKLNPEHSVLKCSLKPEVALTGVSPWLGVIL